MVVSTTRCSYNQGFVAKNRVNSPRVSLKYVCDFSVAYILFLRQACFLAIEEGGITVHTKSLLYMLSVKSVDSINKDRSVASLTRKC